MVKSTKRVLFVLALLLPMLQGTAQSTADGVRTINIGAVTGLQYDLVRFAVKPGEKVKLVFTNQDDMGHNFLITQPGARNEVVNAALQLAEKGPEMDYIPDLPQVLWSIPVIYLGESKVLEFTAPNTPGAYPYVCTYPGHGFVMYGVMYVSSDENMPDIRNDENIPPSRREETATNQEKVPEDHTQHPQQQEEKPALHPYQPIPPYLYRVFIEGSGLASIAVNLPHGLSYCWDAESCRLRFAWEGDFLDNTDLWHGHKNAYAKILGEIFYRDRSTYPLRIKNPGTIPDTEFKGYRLIDRYPEFHYRLSGLDVYELIRPKPDGSGLIRTFRLPELNEDLWFVFSPIDGVVYEASHGKEESGKIKFPVGNNREFTIIMTKAKGK